MPVAINPLERDYVYIAEDSGAYRHTRVVVTIGEDAAEITLMPAHAMTCTEIDSVLSNIENDVLKRTRIGLLDECRAVLKFEGQTYTILLSDGTPRVTGLCPAADQAGN